MSSSLRFPRAIGLLCAALAFAAANAALAQLRTIPADTKRATLTHVAGMTVDMNGNRVQLAAGAQIRDTQNLIIVPSALPPGATVKYQLDSQGQIWRLWILSPLEIAQPDPRK